MFLFHLRERWDTHIEHDDEAQPRQDDQDRVSMNLPREEWCIRRGIQLVSAHVVVSEQEMKALSSSLPFSDLTLPPTKMRQPRLLPSPCAAMLPMDDAAVIANS